ncbi:MAG: single-stranded DNA-binding protein [Bacteroidales bacterium]|nr:single-stranded DNA-binding protein [Bacteroidales bacterium]
MEFINKIEIRGIVGTANLAVNGDRQYCKFSVVTDFASRRDGSPVIDSTWFNVTAWEGRGMPDLSKIVKGTWVQVQGRIRTYKFTTSEGTDRLGWEIYARQVFLLEPDGDPMQPQRFQ